MEPAQHTVAGLGKEAVAGDRHCFVCAYEFGEDIEVVFAGFVSAKVV